jgi:hypothetical protein
MAKRYHSLKSPACWCVSITVASLIVKRESQHHVSGCGVFQKASYQLAQFPKQL